MLIPCVFCGRACDGVGVLKDHSATCPDHPAVKRAKVLEDALRPFAVAGELAAVDGEPDGDFVSGVLRQCPTVADCRRAAAVLAPPDPTAN